ncbi:hypothetical protein CcaCcLH18_13613 [Colletotrichum camelliae]|nr:hypothetical protein CcaCcLH18_13613 [Colletotrichum camelliae]
MATAIQALKGDAPQQVRSLYRQMLRTGDQFAAYNFREYAKRRTRDAFRENKDVTDQRRVQELIQKGLNELTAMKRQTVVSQFFQFDRLVVEGGAAGKQKGDKGDIVRQKDQGFTCADRNSARDIPRDPGALWFATRLGPPVEPIPGMARLRYSLSIDHPSNTITSVALPRSIEVAGLNIFVASTRTRRMHREVPVSRHSSRKNYDSTGRPYAHRDSTRRANRSGYAEHDDFEGLPVRQWRQEWVNVQPPQQTETTQKNDIWDVELPWGMPKDAGLLPQHSQDLLRAARSGVLYKRPAPTEDDEENADAVAEKPEKKEDETADKGFQIKVWKQINRNSEGTTVSHLAKRRKGTVTISSKTVAATPVGATVTRATVRKMDAAGNPYTQEITLQDGQQVEGEIISTTVVPVSALDPAQQQPQRVRRPPPPKKKNKPGPGRGRKKKNLPLPAPAPGAPAVPAAAPPVEGAPVVPKVEGAEGPENGVIKQEREDSNKPDSEMADNDDDEEGDDDGDDGDDGDDNEEEQREGENTDSQSQDHEMTDASPSVPTPTVDASTVSTEPESPLASRSGLPANPINLAPPLPAMHLANASPRGSPLKNVVLPSPTEPSPQISPIAEILAPAASAEPIASEAAAAPEAPAIPEAAPVPEPSPVPVPAPVVESQQEDVNMADQPEPAPEAPAEQPPAPASEQLPLDTASETVNETYIPPAEKVGDIVSPMAETRSTFSMATTAETEGSGSRIESADQTIASNDAPQEDSMALDIPDIPEATQAPESVSVPEVTDAQPAAKSPSAPAVEEQPAPPMVQEDSEMKDDSVPAPSVATEQLSFPDPVEEKETSEPMAEDVPPTVAPTEPEHHPEPIKSPVKSPIKSPLKSPEPVVAPIESLPPIEAPADVMSDAPTQALDLPPVETPAEVPVDAPVPAPIEPTVEPEAPAEELPVDIPIEPAAEAQLEAAVDPASEALIEAPTQLPIDAPPAPIEPPVQTIVEPPTEPSAEIPTAEPEANPPAVAEVPLVPVVDEGPDLLAGLETELDRQAEMSKSPLPEPPAAPHPEPAELPHVENPVPLPEVPPVEPEKPAEEPKVPTPEPAAAPAPEPAPAPAPETAPAADPTPAVEAPASGEPAAPSDEPEKKTETKTDEPADP